MKKKIIPLVIAFTMAFTSISAFAEGEVDGGGGTNTSEQTGGDNSGNTGSGDGTTDTGTTGTGTTDTGTTDTGTTDTGTTGTGTDTTGTGTTSTPTEVADLAGLKTAIDGAVDNTETTLKLAASISAESLKSSEAFTIAAKKDIIIDLNGNSLKFEGTDVNAFVLNGDSTDKAKLKIVNTGDDATIEATGHAIIVNNSSEFEIPDNITGKVTIKSSKNGIRGLNTSKVTVGKKAAIDAATVGIFIFGAETGTGNGPTLTISGNVKNNSTNYPAVSGNGLDKLKSTITIAPGAVINGGVYLPQTSEVKINGKTADKTTITGESGIAIKSGTLDIVGNVEISGTLNEDTGSLGDGVANSAAIDIDCNNAYAGEMQITIKADETDDSAPKLSAASGYAIHKVGTANKLVFLDISAGEFAGVAETKTAIKGFAEADVTADIIKITGGKFSSDVSALLKAEYEANKPEGSELYEVKLKEVPPVVDKPSYGNIDDDDDVDKDDAAALIAIVRSREILDGDDLKYADLDKDTKLTSTDAALIIKKVLNPEFKSPAEAAASQQTPPAE